VHGRDDVGAHEIVPYFSAHYSNTDEGHVKLLLDFAFCGQRERCAKHNQGENDGLLWASLFLEDAFRPKHWPSKR